MFNTSKATCFIKDDAQRSKKNSLVAKCLGFGFLKISCADFSLV